MCIIFTIDESIRVCSKYIVIDITFYLFEAGQKLVRSRSNYFSSIAIELLLQDGQCKLCGCFWFDRERFMNGFYYRHDS